MLWVSRSFDAFLFCRDPAMLAPVIATVLYDKGKVWPFAVFCPATTLVAVFCGKVYVSATAPKCGMVGSSSLYNSK